MLSQPKRDSGLVIFVHFQYEVDTLETIENTEWKKDWISEIHIEADLGGILETREFLTYDVTDLIGDVGGYLGLLLGWSLLGITIYFSKLIFMFKSCCNIKD